MPDGGAARKGRTLLYCCPAYQSRVHVRHVASLVGTISDLASIGWTVQLHWMTGCARITRARNELMAAFGLSGADYMLMVDSDIAWPADAARRLIEHDLPFTAVAGVTRGTQSTCVRPESGRNDFAYHTGANLLRVGAVGTGMIMLRRDVLTRMIEGYPDLKRRDHRLAPELEAWCYGFFDEMVVDGHAEGEDYAFCERWRAIGGEIFVDPTIKLGHFGEVEHVSDLGAGIKLETEAEVDGLVNVAGVWCPKADPWFVPRLRASHGNLDGELIERVCGLVPAERRGQGAVAVDVGAHIGTWSRQLRETFGRVVAIEPDPVNFAILERNVLDRPGVNVLFAACGAASGPQKMSFTRAGAVNSGQAHVMNGAAASVDFEASVINLDALRLTNVGLVKIDVEGFEAEVIEGARETLEREHPVVVLEENWLAKRYGREIGEARSLLESLGMREVWRETIGPQSYNVVMNWSAG